MPRSVQGPHRPSAHKSAFDVSSDPAPSRLASPPDGSPSSEPVGRVELAIYYDFDRAGFGPYIKQLRENAGLSLRQAASHLAVPYSYIQRLETEGRARKPDLEFLEKLATLYGVGVSEMERSAGVRREELEDPLHLVHEQFKAIVMHPMWAPPGMTEDWLESFSVRQKRQIIQMMRQAGEQIRSGSSTPNEVLLEVDLLTPGPV